MGKPTETRAPVVSDELQAELTEILGFRHFFRHAYPMRLDWDLIQPLVKKLAFVPKTFDREIRLFLDSVENPKRQ